MVGGLSSHFDKNVKYRLLRLNDDGCVGEFTPNADVCDSLNVHAPGSSDACLQRCGAITMLPAYAGLPIAQVVETSCIHRGDSSCRVEVRFGKGTKVPPVGYIMPRNPMTH